MEKWKEIIYQLTNFLMLFFILRNYASTLELCLINKKSYTFSTSTVSFSCFLLWTLHVLAAACLAGWYSFLFTQFISQNNLFMDCVCLGHVENVWLVGYCFHCCYVLNIIRHRIASHLIPVSTKYSSVSCSAQLNVIWTLIQIREIHSLSHSTSWKCLWVK